MQIRVFDIPGMPLLVDPVAPIAIQNDGRKPIKGTLNGHVICQVPVPTTETPSRVLLMQMGKIFPVEGPDVLAVGLRAVQALVTAGVIEDGRQIVDLTLSKEYGQPGVSIVIMERG